MAFIHRGVHAIGVIAVHVAVYAMRSGHHHLIGDADSARAALNIVGKMIGIGKFQIAMALAALLIPRRQIIVGASS